MFDRLTGLNVWDFNATSCCVFMEKERRGDGWIN